MKNSVMHYFKEIAQIPRCSGHEEKIGSYLKKHVEKNGFYVEADRVGNILIRKDASEKYKNYPGIILQGHMDMVCEKQADSNHDFMKDPIELIVKDGFLTANKTTLGADNGIALAMGLSILDEKETPQVEVIITVNEEVDMKGALNFNLPLEGKYFLNIDSEEEGVLVAGSAGGETAEIRIKKELAPSDYKTAFRLIVTGLKGGHSGMEIGKSLGNAILLLNEFLKESEDYIRVESFVGGTKDNAIPRGAEARIETQEDWDIKSSLADYISNKKKMMSLEDDRFDILLEPVKVSETLSKEMETRLINLLKELPNGVASLVRGNDNLVETSSNLAKIEEKDDEFVITISIRSSKENGIQSIKEKIKSIVEKEKATVKFTNKYPAWEFKEDSSLRNKAISLYHDLTGQQMETQILHAGLECGVFYEKYPQLDYISIGPNIYDVHTPDEKLDLKSSDRFYEYLLKLIQSVNDF